MTKITHKVAREYVRILGGTIRRDSAGDLRIHFKDLGTEADYFIPHMDDAIETARIMRGTHPNFEQAETYLNEMAR